MKNLKGGAFWKYGSLITLIFLMGLLCLASCKKKWSCNIRAYGMTAIKGTDTIRNSGVLSASDYSYNESYLQSLIDYYRNNGYTLILDSGYYSGPSQYVTRKSEVTALEKDGYKCIIQ